MKQIHSYCIRLKCIIKFTLTAVQASYLHLDCHLQKTLVFFYTFVHKHFLLVLKIESVIFLVTFRFYLLSNVRRVFFCLPLKSPVVNVNVKKKKINIWSCTSLDYSKWLENSSISNLLCTSREPDVWKLKYYLKL